MPVSSVVQFGSVAGGCTLCERRVRAAIDQREQVWQARAAERVHDRQVCAVEPDEQRSRAHAHGATLRSTPSKSSSQPTPNRPSTLRVTSASS